MCCLFGIADTGHCLSVRQKTRLLTALATAAESRGTDATGIAYFSRGRLHIYKRPVPAHRIRFRVPEDAAVIMGHTRMATQGDARLSYNAHPFLGTSESGPFALAHNGMIQNDGLLRRTLRLPGTKIETDSYIAVQLLEKKRTLDFQSLRYMAEQLEGSFTITVLGPGNTLYFVKGDNPMCIYHFPSLGLYLYASTEEILKYALRKEKLPRHVSVQVHCGEILQLRADGSTSRSHFDDAKLFRRWYSPVWDSCPCRAIGEDPYLTALKDVAMCFGYSPDDIDTLASQGFTAEDIEEFLYSGE